eukprot:TRINITY_DN64572_c0_g1_i1.p2 TRINITY_DN64572_c0_g1~~TRINITY_DN64572_c0_g1_i1.p2  ORF type:complete len:288 (+),score=11.27 TRINITY_DN64572_c0_g1_i1:48-911(+)
MDMDPWMHFYQPPPPDSVHLHQPYPPHHLFPLAAPPPDLARGITLPPIAHEALAVFQHYLRDVQHPLLTALRLTAQHIHRRYQENTDGQLMAPPVWAMGIHHDGYVTLLPCLAAWDQVQQDLLVDLMDSSRETWRNRTRAVLPVYFPSAANCQAEAVMWATPCQAHQDCALTDLTTVTDGPTHEMTGAPVDTLHCAENLIQWTNPYTHERLWTKATTTDMIPWDEGTFLHMPTTQSGFQLSWPLMQEAQTVFMEYADHFQGLPETTSPSPEGTLLQMLNPPRNNFLR